MTEYTRKAWTAEEEAQLRELYPDHRNSEIAKLMGRSITSVWAKGKALGLAKSQRFWCANGRLWTKEDMDFVAAHYASTDSKSIAAHIGRSPKAVQIMANALGIRKSDEYIAAKNARISREARTSKSAEELAAWDKKSGASLHRRYLSERRRLIFGLPQKTNMKVRLRGDRKKDYHMNHLKRWYGYHVFSDTRSCVYYSDGTRRSAKAEEYAKRVYHLCILPLSDRSRD